VLDEVVEQGRSEVERADSLALEEHQRLLGVPRGLRHVAAADQRGGKQRVDAHRVVERHHSERAVARPEPVLHHL
jgi:hypothetical protein